jgi:predicted NBD/HSP70 family sugar kinase
LSEPSVVLAVDLGGSQLRGALVGGDGSELGFAARPTAAGDASAVVGQVVRLVRELVDGSDDLPPRALGIGVPGVPDPTSGLLGRIPNVRGLDGVPLRERLEAALGLPVALENDVNLAALGEGWLGRARGLRDFAFMAVGTGVGLGVVAGGVLVRGAHGAAGEIAWLPLGVDPFDPTHQRRGPLEESAGGSGIANRYLGPEVSGHDVFMAGEAGDSAAVDLLDRQAEALALAVRTVECVLDPALVVVGGGIGIRPDVLERIRSKLSRLSTSPGRVESSALGDRAALMGAARVALDLAAEGS